MKNPNRKSSSRAVWWSIGGLLLALVIFIGVELGVLVALQTGEYRRILGGVDSFLDWQFAGAAMVALMLCGLLTAAWIWRRLTILDERDESTED